MSKPASFKFGSSSYEDMKIPRMIVPNNHVPASFEDSEYVYQKSR